ncbi:MAG: synthase subunit delta [Pseudomonadota bacterium]
MAEISTIARPYAVAAFNLAKEKKSLSEWSEMLEFLAQVSLDERMHAFINDSKVSDEDREKALVKIAGKKLNQYGENLIKLLIEFKRLNVLPEISHLFEILKATDEGTLDAEIIVASKPTDKEVDTLVKSLEKKFNKKIGAAYQSLTAIKEQILERKKLKSDIEERADKMVNIEVLAFAVTQYRKIEAEFDVETECFPMKGKATVYYSPSEQSDENDEELIIKIMSQAVKSAMDSNVLLTDTVIATYFIGERDSFKFRSSEYYYLEGSPGYPDSASWTQRNIGLIAGTAAALVAIIIMICICHKRQKNKAVSDSQSQAVKKEVKKDQLPTKVQG